MDVHAVLEHRLIGQSCFFLQQLGLEDGSLRGQTGESASA
jgi:hypothetical protein